MRRKDSELGGKCIGCDGGVVRNYANGEDILECTAPSIAGLWFAG